MQKLLTYKTYVNIGLGLSLSLIQHSMIKAKVIWWLFEYYNNNNGDKLIAFAQLRWRSRVAVSLGCWFCSLSFSFFSMRNQLFTYIKLLFAHDRALSVKKFASGGGIGSWVQATLLYVKTWKISLDALYIVLSVDFKWVKFIRTIYWFNFYLLLM